MRWTDMDNRQQTERTIIVKTLSAAGWKEAPFSAMFVEKNLTFDTVAELDYQSEKIFLHVGYVASEHTLYFSIHRAAFSNSSIGLIIFFEDKLTELLKLIQGFQDQISPENYKEYIRSLLNLCPKIFVDEHEKGRIPLLPNYE